MNLKKLTQMLMLMIMIPVIHSCAKKNKIIAISNHKKAIDNQNSLCDDRISKGSFNVLCKKWQSNTIVLSKSTYSQGEKLFVEIFPGNNQYNNILIHTDSITNCPVDFFIEYLDNSFELTDLDNNGIEEITFVYQKACRGGIEPADLRLIKIEGDDIYTIYGKRILAMDAKQHDFQKKRDNYTVSKKFAKAPQVFLNHSKKKWEEFLIEH
ncbi:hypothetical protein [Aquimarina sp. MMG016]|uniref:M949_RS01915 family surface polysaccharide biosynthesis protein n=1 Tax=Aquimarina sp. MMG016 TaxID=2822690 RepID=UPI001B3A3562|nr:hypothetical protein [Aquimarina sp. MMG016]MBQ4822425.1 hypothetical protein [Aquimarina sp. MMG016]